jgi:hypothetical protein
MILQPEAKILVAHRRFYSEDHTRYFIGEVEAYEEGIARITGNTWLRDGYQGTFHKKEDLRTKIIALASGSMIVYQLPDSVDLPSLDFHSEGTRIFLRDDQGFEMDMTEGVLRAGAPIQRPRVA